MTQFKDFVLPASLLSALERMEITVPTDIQTAAIPPALEGKDLLGSAETGSGKTLAYCLPLLAHLLKVEQPPAPGALTGALVLAPTREIATQIYDTIHKLLDARGNNLRLALLIGGEPMPKQFSQLRGRPRIIIGTPGRINDHLERGSLMLDRTNFLVIDETDRMLDMGFGMQLDAILEHLPKERQTLMFSATFPKHIEKLAAKYLNNPIRIAIGVASKPVDTIQQKFIHTSISEKFANLSRELLAREGSVIIFVKTKRGAEVLADRLFDEDHSADAIHGDLFQRKREKVLDSFRDGKKRILVATDVAARGIDVPHIKHVINYDLPQCPEDYVHRIGRTGRAGASGEALSLVSPDEKHLWHAIDRFINTQAGGGRQQFAPRGSGGGARGGRGGRGGPRNFDGPRFDGARRGDDRQGFDSPRNFDRPRFDGPQRGDERPRFDGPRNFDKPRFDGPRRGDERPRFDGPRNFDKPRFDGPSRSDERPRFDSPRNFDKPRFDGPRRGDDRPHFDGPPRRDVRPDNGKPAWGKGKKTAGGRTSFSPAFMQDGGKGRSAERKFRPRAPH